MALEASTRAQVSTRKWSILISIRKQAGYYELLILNCFSPFFRFQPYGQAKDHRASVKNPRKKEFLRFFGAQSCVQTFLQFLFVSLSSVCFVTGNITVGQHQVDNIKGNQPSQVSHFCGIFSKPKFVYMILCQLFHQIPPPFVMLHELPLF